MTFIEPALNLLARGKPVFPVDRGTKRPLVEWKAFQKRIPTDGELATWGTLFPDANIGMATGKLSGTVVIDCDSPEAASRFLESYPEAGETLQAKTGRGLHFYFQFEDGIRNDAGKRLGEGIDIRGEGDFVVIPPSVHGNGNAYAWLNRKSPAKLPLSLREILVARPVDNQNGYPCRIAFNHRGKEYRQSSGSEKETVARRLLKQRLAEVGTGRFIVNEDKLSFEDMVQDIENDYQVNGKRSLASVRFYLKHLRGFYGMDRAIDITPDRVRAYQNFRVKEGASNATVNREVATLGRMLTLAVNSGKLSRKPRMEMLSENNIREGFLDHGDFTRLLDNLPDHLKSVIEFLYLSGWRKGEAVKLEWRDVDIQGRAVRLRIANSKNKEARILPLTGRLLEIIQERAEARRLDCPLVFHHDGQSAGDFKKAWKTATRKAGLEGTLVHDLRRCAARNLSRAGVPEQVAMSITGHKTRSMYQRYRIVDERDLREATERLQAHLEGQDGAKVIPIRANG